MQYCFTYTFYVNKKNKDWQNIKTFLVKTIAMGQFYFYLVNHPILVRNKGKIIKKGAMKILRSCKAYF